MVLLRNISDPRRLRETCLFVFGLIVFAAAIIYLVNKVNQELQMLSLAHSDVVQWNLSRAELEHSKLVETLLRSELGQDVSQTDIITDFDIFYSRIETIETGHLYHDFRTDAVSLQALAEIRGYLDKWATIFDNPQIDFAGVFSEFSNETAAMGAPIQHMVLRAVSYFASLQVKHRTTLSYTLLGILLLSCFLLMVLLFLIRMLNNLNLENKHRAKQNEQDRAHMDAIVSSSLDAIIVADQDGVISEFKGAASQIFGYAKSDVLDTHISRLIHVADKNGSLPSLPHGNVSVVLNNIIGQGRARAEGRRKSGQYFPAEVAVEVAKSHESSVLVVFIRDISNETEAEKKLLAARDSAVAGERSKSQLLAVMSHEIRTPLNGLIGSMELLRQTGLTEDQLEYLRMMSHSGSLLLSHVNNVLDISRLEAGQMDLQRKVFNLIDLIAEIVAGQQVVAADRDNMIVFDEAATGAVLVESDRLRLGQILLNIISNANKFTNNGEIRVEVEVLDRRNNIEIRIADTGIGIAEDQTSRIFQDFATGDASFTRRNEGTGLGLGIARRIARAMGGDIHVVSELGEGSIFTVCLPIAASDHVTTDECDTHGRAEQKVAQAAAHPLKILVVEDNEINRMVVSQLLAKDGHQVVEAVDGYEGVAAANSEVFDLILMDISMPSMDGTQVTKIIRSGNGLNAKTPITALTAHAMEEDVRLFIASGMNEVLVKPLTQSALRAMISRVQAHVIAPAVRDQGSNNVVNVDVVRQFHAEIGSDLFNGLSRKFINEMDAQLPLLATSDDSSAGKTAHKLAGSAAIFGAAQLVEQLRAVELSFKRGDYDIARDLARQAEATWANTRVQLEKLYSQLIAA